MDARPIGFLDSGIGGITVLDEALRCLPHEHFLYYGDVRHAPYGDKSSEQVLEYVSRGAELLIGEGCKALVLACNTATAAAAAPLRSRLSLPIIGIEPALKPASLLPGEGKVAVLATRLTLEMPKFRALYDQYGKDAILLPCPGLMDCVEAGELEGERVNALLAQHLKPCKNLPIKAAVLGCTHYPFLRASIAKHFPKGTPIIDGSAGTARQLGRRLEEAGLLNPGTEPGQIRFLTSGEESAIRKMETMLALYRRQKEQA